MSQVIECLPSRHKVQDSIPSTEERRKRERERDREKESGGREEGRKEERKER
jgi:hypothetical protein